MFYSKRAVRAYSLCSHRAASNFSAEDRHVLFEFQVSEVERHGAYAAVDFGGASMQNRRALGTG
jgi:hypothetical protein